jgi:CheY-like chemotaxis protein/two-component sensor histidine kinase
VENGLGTDIHPAPLFVKGTDSPPAGDAIKDFDILKGQFLASLNHELRTPLSGVIGMTDLLAETTLHGDQREYVETIRECASQLLEALNALLDFSSLSAGHTQTQNAEFALRALLDSVASDAASRAEGKSLRFIRDWDSTIPESVIGDERYLRQVLQHLLRNAIKFTNRGEITLSVDFDFGSPGTRLRIQVKDTGIGIPGDKLRVIFQAFRQLDAGLARSYSGLGLGLALSDKLVRLMGGEITVESEVGRGTTFTIRLPLTIPMHALKPGMPDANGRRRPLVLVVEDNKIAQRVVEHILERAECEVVFADDGETGIRMAASRVVDLILMDLQMPGMDGFATSRAIRDLPGGRDIPILALTANYSDEHRAICHQIGMQGFLSKPIRRDELLSAVQAHLPMAS